MTESEYFAYHMQQEWKKAITESVNSNTPVKQSNLDKHTYQRNDSNVVFVNFKRLRKDG